MDLRDRRNAARIGKAITSMASPTPTGELKADVTLYYGDSPGELRRITDVTTHHSVGPVSVELVDATGLDRDSWWQILSAVNSAGFGGKKLGKHGGVRFTCVFDPADLSRPKPEIKVAGRTIDYRTITPNEAASKRAARRKR